MTKEQIIIDGVNVCKCEHFRLSCRPDYSGGYLYKNICRNHGFYDCNKKPCAFKCIEYQKQLTRKTQECEALQLSENEAKEIIAELRQKLKIQKREIDTAKENYAHQKDCTELYYKALEKIEEIANEEIVCDNCILRDTNKCDSRLCTSFYLDGFCKNLLTIINEVKYGTIQTKI